MTLLIVLSPGLPAACGMPERNRRSVEYFDASTTWGIAECIAKFERDQAEDTRRNLGILRARAAVAREALFPDRLEERMPQIAAVVIGYLNGERRSNRERASAVGVSDSTCREVWASLVDWLLVQMIEAEQWASLQLRRAVGGNFG